MLSPLFKIVFGDFKKRLRRIRASTLGLRIIKCALAKFFEQAFETKQATLVVQMVKNRPVIQETPIRFLGREDFLEKGMATHSRGVAESWTTQQLTLSTFQRSLGDGFSWEGCQPSCLCYRKPVSQGAGRECLEGSHPNWAVSASTDKCIYPCKVS